jgi:hypothetical protein
MHPIFPGSRWPIAVSEVNDSINFIVDVVEAIDQVIA